MAEADIRYRRGQLVEANAEESARIGVPGNRRWLVLQNENTKERLDVVVCYVTAMYNDYGQKRLKRSTDVVLKKGTKIGEDRKMTEDSYIRCHQIYTLRTDSIHFVGRIPDPLMFKVDERLRSLLALPAKLDAYQQLLLDNMLQKTNHVKP